MNAAAAERFLAQTAALPTMPEVATKLIRSFDDDNISLGALAALIGKDSTLTAKVLRLANSARYSPSHKIDHLQDAAAALGMDTLRNLSLAASLCGAFPVVKGLDRSTFWRHSLATATYASLLCKQLQMDAETAYLSGLMLRTGELLMAMQQPDAVAEAETHTARPGSRFEVEQARFDCTHADVTAKLAARWHFPDTLVEAFSHASAPLETRPFNRMGAVLHLAEVLADAVEHHEGATAALQLVEPELVEHLHLDLTLLEKMITAAGDVGSEVEALLH
ncbi:HDOD domain-containing protein [Pelomonas sp. KK5]|uniref:HDOD domain-containing protein n=1 Tax=Pelomonas sp. KK5 TaxID=1855730 RepID=UPI00097C0055|nr:HDOD domain-containing protein [Pelomonas sp. KK5]